MNALMPRRPAAGSVTANTRATSAFLPVVMNCFVPESTYPSPSRRARASRAPASEPLLGSERQNAESIWPCAMGRRNSSFCSAVP